MFVAAIGFGIGIYLSYRAQPEILSNLNLAPLFAIVTIGVPATVFLNAVEFQLSAKLIGRPFNLAQSAEITVVGSVANMLPIPGGTMVRVAALKSAGASLKHGTAVTLLVSVLWIGIAFIYSGLWVFGLGNALWPGLGPAFIFGGIAALAVSVALCFRLTENKSVVAYLALNKMALVLVDATRMYLCFRVLGLDGTFAQASVLTVSSVTGAAVSIVPAGLGIREGVAALLGPVVALAASSAYLATGLNRLVGLSVMAPFAVFLGMRKSRSEQVDR